MPEVFEINIYSNMGIPTKVIKQKFYISKEVKEIGSIFLEVKEKYKEQFTGDCNLTYTKLSHLCRNNINLAADQ